jgi:membrane protein YqaA with SNARE-associated domain
MRTVWIHVWCYLLTFVSAIVPWVNGELAVLSLAALVDSPADLASLALVASAGQMTGKSVLYWAARGAAKQPRIQATRLERWRLRFERHPLSAIVIMLVSATIGVPPFYLLTLVAGAMKMNFGGFLAVGTCGRVVHFMLIVFVPHLVIRVRR